MTDHQHDAPTTADEHKSADGSATPAEVAPADVTGPGAASEQSTEGEACEGGAEHHGELAEEPHPDYDELAEQDGRTPGQLFEALEEAQSDRDEYLDALQRSRAEFDNFRRRSAREAAGARAAGVGDLAQQLLDVLDDLDRTVAVAEESSDEGLAVGITAVRRKLVDVLLAAGVERIDEEGVPFDATRHEAVQQVEADEPVDEPEVAQVLRPGYIHRERCLRPAMVSVRQ